jgi:hypothetical protein
MSKTLVTRLFLGGVVAIVAGAVVGVIAVLASLGNGAVTVGGPTVVTVNGPAFAWMLIWLVIATVAVAGGAIAALVSWIGALLNTAQLDDKTWYVLLLVLGVFSFGFLAMFVYVIAGPDGTKHGAPSTGVATAAQA